MFTPIEAKLKSLEKLVHDMAEHAEDLENRGRNKNIASLVYLRVLRAIAPTQLFESWLIRISILLRKQKECIDHLPPSSFLNSDHNIFW